MLSGEKILVTGATGRIGGALCHRLAADNEVWGTGRTGSAGAVAGVNPAVTLCPVDLAEPDLAVLPTDFTYLLHLAAVTEPGITVNRALAVNAESTGLLLAHCRTVKAALVMSSASVYRPHADPGHRYEEADPLGEAVYPGLPGYSLSKITGEVVARASALSLGVKVVIARMNAAYGGRGGLPAQHFDAILAGRPVIVRHDPAWYSPIHEDDIEDQVEALLGAASSPATVVNWCGDEVVSAQQWCAEMGRLAGRRVDIRVEEVPGGHRGLAMDASRRRALTGACRVDFRHGVGLLHHGRDDVRSRVGGAAGW